MRKTISLFIAAIAIAVAGCHNGSEYDMLPPGAARFITRYWPDPYIKSVTKPSKDDTQVVVKGGPTITFGSDSYWVEIDGNGMTLPQVLLFDQLPPVLYDYLESGEYLNQVFKIGRDPRRYEVEILTGSLAYDITSRQIREERD